MGHNPTGSLSRHLPQETTTKTVSLLTPSLGPGQPMPIFTCKQLLWEGCTLCSGKPWVRDPPGQPVQEQLGTAPQPPAGRARSHPPAPTSPLAGRFSDPQILWFPAITSVTKTWYFA